MQLFYTTIWKSRTSSSFLTTDIGKQFTFIKDQKYWLQNLVLMVLHGSFRKRKNKFENLKSVLGEIQE
jgi:hypothetical protein